jgi:peptide/nickel transport system substrate-binding protein
MLTGVLARAYRRPPLSVGDILKAQGGSYYRVEESGSMGRFDGLDVDELVASDASPELKVRELTRRSFLIRSGAVAAAASGVAGSLARGSAAFAAQAAKAAPTLTMASAGAWLNFDPLNSASLASGPSLEILAACSGTLTEVLLPPTLAGAQKAAAAGKLNGIPGLAKSWTVSPDGKTYTFHLQPHAVSGYGNRLSADDVIYMVERSVAAPTSVGAFLLGLCGITKASQVTAVNATTAQITLPAVPPPYFLQIFGLLYVPIYDSKEVKSHVTSSDPYAGAWLSTNVAGYGRYKIQSTTVNSTAILVPNPGYYGTKAPYSKVVQEGVTDQNGRLELLLSGSAQYAEELTALQLTSVKKNKRTAVTPFTSTRVAFVVMDNRKPPFNSPALRQAIARAIPYDEILSSVYKGFAKPWKGQFTPWFQGASGKYWKYNTDPAAARKGLASVKGTSVALSYVEGVGSGQQIAVLVQQALNNAGLNVTLQGLARAEANTLLNSGQMVFQINDQASPVVSHPLYMLQLFYTTKAFANYAHYSNPRIDALTTQLAAVPAKNLAAQNKLIGQAEQILMNDMPYIPIAYTGTFGAETTTVKGVGGDEVGLIRIDRMKP